VLELELEDVELAPVLGDMGERFAARAAAGDRELEVEAPDGLRVQADRQRLEQALTNLIDNALRHGDGEVRVRAEGDGGARTTIHVTDGGPGFPPEFIGQAFERFSRGDPARGRGGTGLGLAIVEGIARSHGGSAGARNMPGGGAEVWIELPGRADPQAREGTSR
jgi:signal transduction histidine kinase